MTTTAPYGSWRSPITAELIVEGAVSLGPPAFGGGDLWWSELRPSEKGRVQLVRKALDADPVAARDVLPEGFSARTRVHEYGGGAWWVHGDTVFFVNWADQRLYRLDPGGGAVAITPEPPSPHGLRYADGRVTGDGRWIVCVRELHGDGETEPRNQLVALRADGSGEAIVLVGDDGDDEPPDFVSNPRFSPDGTTLCWLQWRHPDMPWDATELWVASVDGSTTDRLSIVGAHRIAGGPRESLVQPEWSPNGTLHVISDRTDWWNLYRVEDDGALAALTAYAMDCAQPQWVFGMSSYGFLADGSVVITGFVPGETQFHRVDPDGTVLPLFVPYASIEGVTCADDCVAFLGAGSDLDPAVVTVRGDATEGVTVHRLHRRFAFGPEWWSTFEPIDFATTDGATAHALYYPPRNPEVVAPDGEGPPLIVIGHGGPTSAARPQLNLSIQFWTSRGFGVVDVNYRGSTGYGRRYREALNGQWGIADVDDCVAAARHLVDNQLVDGRRLVIRGSSAGGYTTLCALTFHDDFAAGCSLYGIADLEALASDTHKFESRYTDGLVAPYPEGRDTYIERSPIHHVDRLSTPLLVLQGLEDEVVPPAQAELMVAALRAKGIPHAYLAFEGEQHGFRQAATIRRALEAELYFYGRVLGFVPADPIEPVDIVFL